LVVGVVKFLPVVISLAAVALDGANNLDRTLFTVTLHKGKTSDSYWEKWSP
jgi:hypothetical protein